MALLSDPRQMYDVYRSNHSLWVSDRRIFRVSVQKKTELLNYLGVVLDMEMPASHKMSLPNL